MRNLAPLGQGNFNTRGIIKTTLVGDPKMILPNIKALSLVPSDKKIF
jgi:hypothetical protein